MNKNEILQALQYARTMSKKRKFDQSIELVINFKGVDFKKADNRVDLDIKMPHSTGKQDNAKVLIFAKDKSFASKLGDKVDKVIHDDDIPNLKKKDIEVLMNEYPIFLAEGPAMLTVGKYLGQQLAPKGRMPKPVQANENSIKQATLGVGTTTKVTNKKGKFMPVVHVMVGKESFKDDDLADNILEIYNQVENAVPGKKANIKSAIVKLTMGKPIKIGEKYEAPEPTKEGEEK